MVRSRDSARTIANETLRFVVTVAVLAGWFGQAAAAPSAPAASLDPQKRISQYVLDVWKTADGLPSHHIRSITQTADGYLWLATPGGLARFNGIDFRIFDMETTPALLDENLGPMTLGADGSLWIGSLGAGLYRYQTGEFTHYAVGRDLGNSINALLSARSGTLWIATENGLFYLEENQLQKIELPGQAPISVIAISEDATGSIWVGSRFQRTPLFRVHEGRVTSASTDWPVELGIIQQLYHDTDDVLWIGSDLGLFRVAGQDIQHLTVEQGLTHNLVRTIHQDRAGSLWVGTDGGLNRIHQGEIEAFTVQGGLPDGRFRTVFEGLEGNLWLGTYSGGLVRLKEGPMTSYAVAEGLAGNTVWAVTEDRARNIWIGADGGLSRLAQSSPTALSPFPSLAGSTVMSVRQGTDGEIRVGTEQGLLWVTESSLRRYTTENGLSNNLVKVVYEDPAAADTWWLGTQNGLNRLHNGALTTVVATTGPIHDILRDRSGDLWVSTQSGLIRRQGDSLATVPDLQTTTYTTADGLTSNSFRGLYQDADDTLWIGTYGGGLVRFSGGTFTTFTARDGLDTNDVWSILEDDSGYLWLTNDHGVQQLRKSDLEEVAQGRLETVPTRKYGLSDGMKNVECNSQGAPAGWKASDGKLWFATMHGAVAVDPQKSAPPPVILSTTIESVIVSGHVVAPAEELRLEPNQRDVEINYAAVSLREPGRLQYRYQLEGFDSTWREIGPRRSAFYTNLPPGTYTFRVQARGEQAPWQEPGATLRLLRLPHLHEQPWLRGMVAFLMATMAYLVYLARVQRIRKRSAHLQTINRKMASTVQALETKNAELERFSYTVSHDLKNPLLTILGFAGVSKKRVEQGQLDRLDSDLDRITSAAKTMHQLLDDLLELSRVGEVVGPAEPIQLSGLLEEVASLLHEALRRRGVELVMSPDLPTVSGDRGRILEVFQNLIENAIKFMGEQGSPRIEIVAKQQSDTVTCSVSDNGIGVAPEYKNKIFGLFDRLDPSIDGTGVGLALVKRIVETHGGQIWLESSGAGTGSTFLFTLPRSWDSRGHDGRSVPAHAG